MPENDSNPPTAAPPEGAKPQEAASEPREEKRLRCVDLFTLEAPFRTLTDRLLVEGSTFEEVIETVEERGGPRMTLAAVKDYFRQSLTLQMQRVRHQMKAAAALKAAVGTDTPEAELAEAAFLTGFMSLSRSGSEVTLKDAEHARLSRQILRLKRDVLHHQEDRDAESVKLIRARTATEKSRRRKLDQGIAKLYEQTQQPGAERQLGPEIIEKIRAIYGLTKPPAPPELLTRAAGTRQPGK